MDNSTEIRECLQLLVDLLGFRPVGKAAREKRERDIQNTWERSVAALRAQPTDVEQIKRQARIDALDEAIRHVAEFTFRPDARIHPDIPWEAMNDVSKSASHSTCQHLAGELQKLRDTEPKPNPL